MKRVAILGSFSGRNKGDLAILRAQLLNLLKGINEPLAIYIFTKDPQFLRQYLEDIPENSHGTQVHIVKSLTSYIGLKTLTILTRCDKIIIGGGGLFFDFGLLNPMFSHLFNLFILSYIFRLLGRKIMVFAVGASNLRSKASRFMTRSVLKSASVISVRDQLTADILGNLTNKQIVLGADPVFLMTPKQTKRTEQIIKSWPRGKRILLCLHRLIFINDNAGNREHLLQLFVSEVRGFAENKNYNLLTYTNSTNQRFARYIAELCDNSAMPALSGENHLLPEEIIALLSNVNLVIASQMHLCIFAYIAGVPFLSIPYTEKVDQFNKMTENTNYLRLTEMADKAKVVEILERTISTGPCPHKNDISKKANTLIELLLQFIRS